MPVTAIPYFGSGSSIEWPPAMTAVASAATSAQPAPCDSCVSRTAPVWASTPFGYPSDAWFTREGYGRDSRIAGLRTTDEAPGAPLGRGACRPAERRGALGRRRGGPGRDRTGAHAD